MVVRCSSSQNAAATTTKIGTWAGTPPSEISLAQKEEPLGEVGEVVDAAGQPFGQAAVQRERAQGHDQAAGSGRG